MQVRKLRRMCLLKRFKRHRLLTMKGLATVKVGVKRPADTWKKGDDLRIDWGYFYVSRPLNMLSQDRQRPRS
jgi:hypothetical protein